MSKNSNLVQEGLEIRKNPMQLRLELRIKTNPYNKSAATQFRKSATSYITIVENPYQNQHLFQKMVPYLHVQRNTAQQKHSNPNKDQLTFKWNHLSPSGAN